jgi:quinol monooxygenase YgiN
MSAYDDPAAADLNTGFVVSVRIIAKDGEADAVADILKSLVGPSMAEPRMKFFMPYRSAINPSEFFVYELYEDRAGWDAHNASAHFLADPVPTLRRVMPGERNALDRSNRKKFPG